MIKVTSEGICRIYEVSVGAKDHRDRRLVIGTTGEVELHRDQINVNNFDERARFLKFMAQKAALKPDQLIDLESQIVAAAKKAAAAEKADEIETPEEAKRPTGDVALPSELLTVPGLIGEIVDYNLRTAIYPQPVLALAAAIAFMATITGRKVRDYTDNRTNLYVLGLAPASSGKEHGRKINKKVAAHANASRFLGPENIASSAGLVVAVVAQEAILFQLDEIGRLIQTMKNPRTAAHLYQIAGELMKLYSSSNVLWASSAYADSKKNRQIDQPHAVVYGTSTPELYWGSITSENITEGLLGRFLVFESPGYVNDQRPAIEDVPEGILRAVRDWVTPPREWSHPTAGNLEILRTVPHEPDALDRFERHIKAINHRRRDEPADRAALWSRSAEKAGKLALLRACSRDRANPRIDLSDVDWGVGVANCLTRRMIRMAFDHVAENEAEDRSKRLLRIIRDETNGITQEKLVYKTRWLASKRDRNELIDTLLESGLIAKQTVPTAGRPKTLLTARS